MTRRRRAIAVFACVGALGVVWAPSVIADRYASGPGGTDGVLTRPDRGWEFVVNAIRASRGAQLGSSSRALARAQAIWNSGPAARSVKLTYMDGPFLLSLPGGTTSSVSPSSRFGWSVFGRVRGEREARMIGLLDYETGRLDWDITREVAR